MYKGIVLILLGFLLSCDTPVINPTTSFQQSNLDSLSMDGRKVKRQVTLAFDIDLTVKDEQSDTLLKNVKVYYDLFYNRPYAPYMDAYLISNNLPGKTSLITNSRGEGNFSFYRLLTVDDKDQIQFILQLYSEPIGYRFSTSSIALAISNDVYRDTISVKIDNIDFYIRPL